MREEILRRYFLMCLKQTIIMDFDQRYHYVSLNLT